MAAKKGRRRRAERKAGSGSARSGSSGGGGRKKPPRKASATDPCDPRGRPRRPGRKYESAADDLLRNPAATANAADEAAAKAERHRGALAAAWDDLVTMIRMVRAYANGTYRQIPWTSIVLILAAVLYFVNPFDVVPDWIPGIGYIDDVAVIGWVAKSLHDDLERFREWERAQG